MIDWRVAADVHVQLGERPVWDDLKGVLIWVDILAGSLHELGPDGDRVCFSVDGTLGAAGLRRDGGYVLAAGDAFVLTDAAGEPQQRLAPAGIPSGVRFNDGVCDPAGRFWAGTTSLDGRAEAGSLYFLTPTGEIRTVFDRVTESNGLGWSPDGTTLYFVDSGETTSRIRAFDFDLDTAAVGPARDLIVFAPADGVADGLTVDSDGCLWVAMWGGASVLRIGPDGARLATLKLPVSQPTCPGFGGSGLTDLYVTSAWEGMEEGEPLAGNVFVTTPGSTGLATPRFAG